MFIDSKLFNYKKSSLQLWQVFFFFFCFFWGLARSSPPSIIKSPRLRVLVRVVVTNKSYPLCSSVAFSDRSGTNRMSSQAESTKAISTLRLLCCATLFWLLSSPNVHLFWKEMCVCFGLCLCAYALVPIRDIQKLFIIIINLGHDECLTELLLQKALLKSLSQHKYTVKHWILKKKSYF